MFKIAFVDLDGTLLNSDNHISNTNFKTLETLHKRNIKIAIVTGRNLFSTQKVLSDNLPIDYLIYSTGVAITDFKTKKILKSFEFTTAKTIDITEFLLNHKLNFFMHFPAPENHNFYYNYVIKDDDFSERFNIYADFSSPLPDKLINVTASQFVIVLPYDLDRYNFLQNEITEEFPDVSLIRATSPLNFKHIWLEIYPKGVNKGRAVSFLSDFLQVPLNNTIAIGNDYNDEAMLETAGKSYVVANAPKDLKQKYTIVADNNNNGFSEAIFKELD